MNRFIQIQGYLWLMIEYSFFEQEVLLYEEYSQIREPFFS